MIILINFTQIGCGYVSIENINNKCFLYQFVQYVEIKNENKVHANNRWFAVKKKTTNIKN